MSGFAGFSFSNKRAPKKPRLDEGEQTPNLVGWDAARPAKASKVAARVAAPAAPSADDDVDPLDAFMAGITKEIAQPSSNVAKKGQEKAAAPWEEFEPEDPVASYYEVYEKAPKRKPAEGSDAEDEEGGEDEEDGDRRNKAIDPIPPVDHSAIEYADVKFDFYNMHHELAKMTDADVASLRADLRISATGIDVQRPVVSFAHLAASLGKELMEGIRRHGFHQPTPIQAQAIPVALSGSDVIGIAKTGSGKTMAFLLPMLAHASAQPVLEKDEGPIGLVICPTRELAVQIEQEFYRFKKHCGIRSVTLAGGLSKQEQFKEIKRGCEIAICNPGRLIDIIRMKGCNLQRVTIAVLDEADRMFDMGFEYQVRSIMQNVRPSRQTMLFSATFPPKIERLARDILRNPVRITIGEVGQAAENISQRIEIVKSESDKWPWLSAKVEQMLANGQVLIFVKSKAAAGELVANFKDLLGKNAEVLHGDLSQDDRMRIISCFRKEKAELLIATDVAARGLDITTIRTVVSFDAARDIQTHTHRIGRTGRAGAVGDAYTLLVDDDQNKKMAALLVDNLEQASQPVGDDLRALAMKYKPYAAAHKLGKSNSREGAGGTGDTTDDTELGLSADS